MMKELLLLLLLLYNSREILNIREEFLIEVECLEEEKGFGRDT